MQTQRINGMEGISTSNNHYNKSNNLKNKSSDISFGTTLANDVSDCLKKVLSSKEYNELLGKFGADGKTQTISIGQRQLSPSCADKVHDFLLTTPKGNAFVGNYLGSADKSPSDKTVVARIREHSGNPNLLNTAEMYIKKGEK